MSDNRNAKPTEVSDEMLMAYADRELDPETRARIDQLLMTDTVLAERLRVFESTRAALAQAFDDVMQEPVPERLLQTLRGRDGETSSRNGRARPSLWEDFRRWLGSGPFLAPALAAAAVAIVAGAGGWGLAKLGAQNLNEGAQYVAVDGSAAGVLQRALEKAYVNETIAANAVSVTPVFTFRDTNGRYCRQYVLEAGGNGFDGMACRGKTGRWEIEIHTARAGVSGSIVPAGDQPEIASRVTRMIDGEFFDPAEDKAVVTKGWK